MRKDNEYFTIGQASQIVNLKEHVLRFWEKEFNELAPKKSPKGRRLYSKKDIHIINTIKTLLYEQKFTVSGARIQLSSFMQKSSLNSTTIKDYETTKPKNETYSQNNTLFEDNSKTTKNLADQKDSLHNAKKAKSQKLDNSKRKQIIIELNNILALLKNTEITR